MLYVFINEIMYFYIETKNYLIIFSMFIDVKADQQKITHWE